jgi:hypothetical protein
MPHKRCRLKRETLATRLVGQYISLYKLHLTSTQGGPDFRPSLVALGAGEQVSNIVYDRARIQDCPPRMRFLHESQLQDRFMQPPGLRPMSDSQYNSQRLPPAMTSNPRDPTRGQYFTR